MCCYKKAISCYTFIVFPNVLLVVCYIVVFCLFLKAFNSHKCASRCFSEKGFSEFRILRKSCNNPAQILPQSCVNPAKIHSHLNSGILCGNGFQSLSNRKKQRNACSDGRLMESQTSLAECKTRAWGEQGNAWGGKGRLGGSEAQGELIKGHEGQQWKTSQNKCNA